MREIDISEPFDEYLENLASRNLRPKTIQHTRRAIVDFIFTNHIICPEDILPEHIERYEERLLDYGLAVNTRRSKLGSVRDFLLYLRARSMVLFDASALIELPKPEKALPRDILTEEEIKELFSLPTLNGRKGIRIRAIVEMLYGTGIRRKELLNLDLYDLDIKQRTLLVRQGKGRKDRLLPVPRTTIKYVRRYIQNKRKNRDRALFLDETGTRLDDGELQNSMYYLGRIAEEKIDARKRITCHVFRHSIATHLVQRGVDIRYVQAFLGHADLASTQIYTRIAATHAAEELERCHPREKMKIPFQ